MFPTYNLSLSKTGHSNVCKVENTKIAVDFIYINIW